MASLAGILNAVCANQDDEYLDAMTLYWMRREGSQ